MKWYIAGRFEDKVRIQSERERVRATGHEVVSTWLDEEMIHTAEDSAKLATEKITPSQARDYAIRDLKELKSAEGILLDTFGNNVRGGREVEWGIMLTRPVYKVVVGLKRNVFHELCTQHFKTWDEAIEWLIGCRR